MPVSGGQITGTRIGFESVALALFMLFSVSCGTADTPETCAACGPPTATAPVAATWTSRPTGLAPHPTATALLPTFPVGATSATVRAPVHEATPTLEPKAALHVFSDWALGPSETQTSRIKGITFDHYQPGDILFAWWLYNYPNADSLRGGARLDACTILMGIVRGQVPYTSVVLHGYLPTGHVKETHDDGLLVVSLIYSKSTAESIDFDVHHYLCPDKIYELADHSSIAPDFR